MFLAWSHNTLGSQLRLSESKTTACIKSNYLNREPDFGSKQSEANGSRMTQPGIFLLFIFIIIALLSGCGGGGSSSDSPIQSVGYLQNCLIDGKVVRWTRMPINVYIDKTDLPQNW